ncbi:hypothetical protein HZA73_08825 [candidate division TA06 bacterium]|nr:hypothetical protein [candidate division TA06 bacterium]
MKKAIFGILFISIFVAGAFAALFLCDGKASLGTGWTISCPSIAGTGTWTTTSDSLFAIVRTTTPQTGTYYYLKAESGSTTRYSDWYQYGGGMDHLGLVNFNLTRPPLMEQ